MIPDLRIIIKNLFLDVITPDHIDFLFSIVDTGSAGRELQNIPIHNVAALGAFNGERPFRFLAKPMAFLPRSSVRIQGVSRCPPGEVEPWGPAGQVYRSNPTRGVKAPFSGGKCASPGFWRSRTEFSGATRGLTTRLQTASW